MKNRESAFNGYADFLGELKSRILSARVSAARAVNRDLILLYWDIGRAIVEKQLQFGWGESVVETLSNDLRMSFPETRGFSPRNLRDMKRFYLVYSKPEIWRQAVAKLGVGKETMVRTNQRQQELIGKLPSERQLRTAVKEAITEKP